MTPPKGRAPHRRDESARLAVLHAADDLLVERGFSRVTIEGIAERAGVAKQTIYRWWSSKVDILLDTLIDDAAQHLTVPDLPSAVDGTRRYLWTYARFLTKEPAGKVLLALLCETQHSPDMADTFKQRFLRPQRELERRLLKRGIDSGELPADLDVDAVLDALLGPILLRALTGARIPRAFTDGLVASTLRPEA
jgi:AcrR family transcriptional regulator